MGLVTDKKWKKLGSINVCGAYVGPCRFDAQRSTFVPSKRRYVLGKSATLDFRSNFKKTPENLRINVYRSFARAA